MKWKQQPLQTHDMFDFERFYRVTKYRVAARENKNNDIPHEFGSSSSNWFTILQVVNMVRDSALVRWL